MEGELDGTGGRLGGRWGKARRKVEGSWGEARKKLGRSWGGARSEEAMMKLGSSQEVAGGSWTRG